MPAFIFLLGVQEFFLRKLIINLKGNSLRSLAKVIDCLKKFKPSLIFKTIFVIKAKGPLTK